MNPNENCGFDDNDDDKVIMMHQYRLIDYNKCTPLVKDVDNMEGCLCRDQGIWQLSTQLCFEAESALGNKVKMLIIKTSGIVMFICPYRWLCVLENVISIYTYINYYVAIYSR